MDFLCLDFVNSRWSVTHAPFQDPLQDRIWLSKLRSRWGLPECTVSPAELEELTRFREFLYRVLIRLCAEQRIGRADLERLNGILASRTSQEILVRQDNLYRLQTIQQSDDRTFVVYPIALSFAEMISAHPLQYLKKCGNPDCDWIFYDDSKGHNRKWCDDRCASLMRVRKHRASIRDQSRP
jgi:predicted RNA-binding Zn ribbon-like protein